MTGFPSTYAGLTAMQRRRRQVAPSAVGVQPLDMEGSPASEARLPPQTASQAATPRLTTGAMPEARGRLAGAGVDPGELRLRQSEQMRRLRALQSRRALLMSQRGWRESSMGEISAINAAISELGGELTDIGSALAPTARDQTPEQRAAARAALVAQFPAAAAESGRMLREDASAIQARREAEFGRIGTTALANRGIRGRFDPAETARFGEIIDPAERQRITRGVDLTGALDARSRRILGQAESVEAAGVRGLQLPEPTETAYGRDVEAARLRRVEAAQRIRVAQEGERTASALAGVEASALDREREMIDARQGAVEARRTAEAANATAADRLAAEVAEAKADALEAQNRAMEAEAKQRLLPHREQRDAAQLKKEIKDLGEQQEESPLATTMGLTIPENEYGVLTQVARAAPALSKTSVQSLRDTVTRIGQLPPNKRAAYANALLTELNSIGGDIEGTRFVERLGMVPFTNRVADFGMFAGSARQIRQNRADTAALIDTLRRHAGLAPIYEGVLWSRNLPSGASGSGGSPDDRRNAGVRGNSAPHRSAARTE